MRSESSSPFSAFKSTSSERLSATSSRSTFLFSSSSSPSSLTSSIATPFPAVSTMFFAISCGIKFAIWLPTRNASNAAFAIFLQPPFFFNAFFPPSFTRLLRLKKFLIFAKRPRWFSFSKPSSSSSPASPASKPPPGKSSPAPSVSIFFAGAASAAFASSAFFAFHISLSASRQRASSKTPSLV